MERNVLMISGVSSFSSIRQFSRAVFPVSAGAGTQHLRRFPGESWPLQVLIIAHADSAAQWQRPWVNTPVATYPGPTFALAHANLSTPEVAACAGANGPV